MEFGFDIKIFFLQINNKIEFFLLQIQIHYYMTDRFDLRFTHKMKCTETPEKWPINITAAWKMDDDSVYLFRGDTYCFRQWNCKDKNNNCVSFDF
jgi:hypothetical protein